MTLKELKELLNKLDYPNDTNIKVAIVEEGFQSWKIYNDVVIQIISSSDAGNIILNVVEK